MCEQTILHLNIHIFALTNCICSSFPLFLRLPFPFLPTFIVMIIGLQLMPADGTRIVLILSKEYSSFENKNESMWQWHHDGEETLLYRVKVTWFYVNDNSCKFPYQPGLQARRVKHMLARQFLHLIIKNQILLTDGTFSICV